MLLPPHCSSKAACCLCAYTCNTSAAAQNPNLLQQQHHNTPMSNLPPPLGGDLPTQQSGGLLLQLLPLPEQILSVGWDLSRWHVDVVSHSSNLVLDSSKLHSTSSTHGRRTEQTQSVHRAYHAVAQSNLHASMTIAWHVPTRASNLDTVCLILNNQAVQLSNRDCTWPCHQSVSLTCWLTCCCAASTALSMCPAVRPAARAVSSIPACTAARESSSSRTVTKSKHIKC